jgi:hypothetical protein
MRIFADSAVDFANTAMIAPKEPVKEAVLRTAEVLLKTLTIQVMKMWLVPGSLFPASKGVLMLRTLMTLPVHCWKVMMLQDRPQTLMPLH